MVAFMLPLGTVLLLSFQASPDPFAPISWLPRLTQFAALLGDDYYLGIFLRTLGLASGVTLASVVVGYPVALWLHTLPSRWRALGLGLILIPLLTNVVVRSIGLILLLSPNGLVNSVLGMLGQDRPLQMLFTWPSVGLALTQVFMPYLVMSLYDSLQGMDKRLQEAAASLGADPTRQFWRVTFPLTLPGLRSGVLLIFLMSSTSYVSASLLGGRRVWTSGMVVYEESLKLLNQPLAAAMAITMLVVSVALTLLINVGMGRLMPWLGGSPQGSLVPLSSSQSWRPALPSSVSALFTKILAWVGPWVKYLVLIFGLGLLAFPLILVVVNSVNDVNLASVGRFVGFTGRWYRQVFEERAYFGSALVSLQLALAATVTSLVLALPAAFALARFPLKGREWIASGLMLPLALPGIAIGLGVLRLLQWYLIIPPFVGLLMVHVVLVVPFVLSMLRASVMQLDRTLEAAAASLGAPPWGVVWRITLPLLTPALVAAGIIAFLITFGEVEVTAFLTTARLTTLPVRIYSEAQFMLEPTVNVISTVLIVTTIVALVVLDKLIGLEQAWQRRG